jgi:hypothetical protein
MAAPKPLTNQKPFDRFLERLSFLHKHRARLQVPCLALISYDFHGDKDANAAELDSNLQPVLQIYRWLFGTLLTNTLLLVSKDSVIFASGSKKLQFIEPFCKNAQSLKFGVPDIRLLHFKDNLSDLRAFLDKLQENRKDQVKIILYSRFLQENLCIILCSCTLLSRLWPLGFVKMSVAVKMNMRLIGNSFLQTCS